MIGIFLALVAGIVAGRIVEASVTASQLWIWGGAMGSLLLAWGSGRKGRIRGAFLLVSILAAGLLLSGRDEGFPSWLLRRIPSMTSVTGRVVSYPDLGVDCIRFVLQPDALPGRIQVTWYGEPSVLPIVRYGERVRVGGETRLPQPFDGFDYPGYLARRGIAATMTAGENGVTVLGGGGASVLRAADGLRRALLGRLRRDLPSRQYALAQSLLLGDRSALDSSLEDAFSRTGLMHLLAVSGLHLGILLAGFWFLIRWIGLRPLLAYPIVGLVVASIILVVGPRVSLLRASLLFAFLACGSVLADLGWILRRSIRPLNGLAAAGIVLLIARPGALWDSGFQLTFAATAGLILWSLLPQWRRLPGRLAARVPGWGRRPASAVVALFLVSAAAQSGAAPVIAAQFKALHPWALMTSVIAIPLAALCLWAGLSAIAFGPIPGVGWLAVRVFSGLLSLLESVVQAFARIPGSELPADGLLGLWMGGLAGFALLVGYWTSCRSSSCTLKSTSMTSGGFFSGGGGPVTRPPRTK